mmetsp:Transcript_63319/g.182136  ORF Transcript_63319/g.182136 Transcript_63319/m.182136 type:complete len:842 (-) Transcript_63319:178-2703(-)
MGAGGGCFRAAPADPSSSPQLEARPALKAQLRPVLKEASRGQRRSGFAGFVGRGPRAQAETLDSVFAALRGADDAQEKEACDWLTEWAGCASPKARAGLVALMQRLMARALAERVAKAEEIASAHTGDGGEGPDFAQLAQHCEEALTLDMAHRAGVRVAAQVLCAASWGGGADEPSTSVVVPELDRLVLLFRRAALASVATSARNLQRWSELEAEIGLPALEKHLPLLSRKAKCLLLALTLVPQGRPQLPVVVKREKALTDAEAQLPDASACVLSCYFESDSGTKFIQGKRVEGGEGHGPRKEFFIAASADAIGRFGPPTELSLGREGVVVTAACEGSRITLSAEGDEAAPTSILMQVGVRDRIIFHTQDGQELGGVVVAKPNRGTLVLDSPGKTMKCTVVRCEAQRPAIPLFEFHRGSGQHWFGAYAGDFGIPSGDALRRRYRTFGKVLALAITNHCKLSFVLPVMFFRVLLRRKTAFVLNDLRGFDNALHVSMKKILKMRPGQFASLKEVEGLPDSLTREEYVASQVSEALCPAAMEEVRAGFESMAPQALLKDVLASELRHAVCPTESHSGSINIRHIFEVVMEDEMAECAAFVEAFWHVVDNLSVEEKKRFLVFVTGVETPPEPGTEQLFIQLPFSAFSQDEYVAMLSMLPQAHTCTNTLELPNYHEALLESGRIPEAGSALNAELRRLLGDKLRLAISETGGYELDGGFLPEASSSTPTAAMAAGPQAPMPVMCDRLPSTAGTAASTPSLEVVEAWRLPNCALDDKPHGLGGGGTPRSSVPRVLRTAADAADGSTAATSLEPQAVLDPVYAKGSQQPRHDVDSLLEDLDNVLKTPV